LFFTDKPTNTAGALPMNHAKSYPNLTDESLLGQCRNDTIKKSKSLSDIQKHDFVFEEFFEGDGHLGIHFSNVDEKVVIRKIIKNSVASETYGLYAGMIVTNVNNIDIVSYSYTQILEMINTSWHHGGGGNGSVFIQFKKPIYNDLLKMLVKHNLLHYYDKFVELGVKSIVDFEFIEQNDLLEMEMNETDILKIMNDIK
jgi:hypothetical protein